MSNTKRVLGWVAPALLVWVAGCASTPGAKPDDMSAQEHHEAAAQEEAQAEAHEAQYDPNARSEGAPATDVSGRIDPQYYNPTAEHRRHAQQHREHAADHEAAAKELEAFEEEECGKFTPEVRESCPLMGKVLSFEDIDEQQGGQGGRMQPAKKLGVRIHFAPDVDVDAVAAHMRCHLAFARKMGRKGMNHCPLYVGGIEVAEAAPAPSESMHGGKGHSATAGKDEPGSKTVGPARAAKRLRVEKGTEAGTVDLLIDDPTLLEQLRKRVREHMPHGD